MTMPTSSVLPQATRKPLSQDDWSVRPVGEGVASQREPERAKLSSSIHRKNQNTSCAASRVRNLTSEYMRGVSIMRCPLPSP